MDKNKIKKELSKFSKEDIIDCLIEDSLFTFNDYRLNDFIRKLKSRKFLNDLDRQQAEFERVSEESSVAMKLYFDWKKKVVEKYGKDGQVKLGDLPPDELQLGAKLEADYEKKNKAYMELVHKEAKVWVRTFLST